ncbi:MAG: outer membrane protein assembly factor BamD [Myxococcales bacterium]|nr:outer membrane protein assembly factor BamD [Myxococcales bacterium]
MPAPSTSADGAAPARVARISPPRRRPSARRARRTVGAAALVTALCLASGCAGSKLESAKVAKLSYGESAQAAYERALYEFRKDHCPKAEPGFRAVRREFPYSRFAALAELRLADCKFKAKSYAEAIQAYREFVRFRPSHSQVPYARFRIAESYYQQIPSDFFLAPPAYERDQQPTRDALQHLQRFIADYPDDPRVPEANEMVMKAMRMLARHELYVAHFYARRDDHEAVIRRAKTVINAYAGTGLEPEAMALLAHAYDKTGQHAEAREVRETLVARFPTSEEAKAARRRLR